MLNKRQTNNPLNTFLIFKFKNLPRRAPYSTQIYESFSSLKSILISTCSTKKK